jgi:uncharacterized protein YndB with AHSA1/START domain
MDIDRAAPAIAGSEIEVAATPEAVWDVLTDFEGWPGWNPAVKTVSIDGLVAPGTSFTWKAGASTLTSTIREVDPPRSVVWTGRTMGIHAIHAWRLEPTAGGTGVRTEESWTGLLPRLLPGRMTRTLQESLDEGLGHLKNAVEGRPPSADATPEP